MTKQGNILLAVLFAYVTLVSFAFSLQIEKISKDNQRALKAIESQIKDVVKVQQDIIAIITKDITAESIGDLSDVTITALADGEVLVSSSGVWINQTLAEAGIMAVGGSVNESQIVDSTILARVGDAETITAVWTYNETPETNAIAERTAGSGVTVDGLLIKDGGIPSGAVTAHEGDITHNNLTGLNAGDYRHLTATEYTDLTDGTSTTLHTHSQYLTGISGENLGNLSDVTITAVGNNEVLQWTTSGGGHWRNRTYAEAGISVVGHTHSEYLEDITAESIGD